MQPPESVFFDRSAQQRIGQEPTKILGWQIGRSVLERDQYSVRQRERKRLSA